MCTDNTVNNPRGKVESKTGKVPNKRGGQLNVESDGQKVTIKLKNGDFVAVFVVSDPNVELVPLLMGIQLM